MMPTTALKGTIYCVTVEISIIFFFARMFAGLLMADSMRHLSVTLLHPGNAWAMLDSARILTVSARECAHVTQR